MFKKYISATYSEMLITNHSTMKLHLVSSFYLRTAKFDRPIRVDIITEDVNLANELSSVLLSLVGHSGYDMPSILIEAEYRARLSESDAEWFYQELINGVGYLPTAWKLRREKIF